MEDWDIVQLSTSIKDLEIDVAKKRKKRIDAELEAWQNIDFDSEGIKLAKQKETRVRQEIDQPVMALKMAEAELNHMERLFKISYTYFGKNEEK